MGKKKQTKKFLKKGLEGELERRKKAKPFKAKQAAKVKRDEIKAVARAQREAAPKKKTISSKPMGKMSVDEFMAKGFDDLLEGSSDESDLDLDALDDDEEEEAAAAAGGGGAGPAVTADDDDDEASDDEEDEDEDDEDDGAFDFSGAAVTPADESAEEEEDDDDDDDDSDADELEEDHESMTDSISAHKKSLAKLKAQDPEFYKYLQDNDKDVLGFAEDEVSGDEDGEAGDDDDEEEEVLDEDEQEALEPEEAPKKEAAATAKVLTKATIAQWTVLLKKNSVGTFRKVVRAIYETVLSGENEADVLMKGKQRYKLASSGTFNALIKCACKYVGPLLDHHLPVKHAKIGKGTPLPSTSKAWKKFRAPVKVYLESIAQLLSQLKDPDAANFVLHYDKLLCPYYACFPKLNRFHFKKMLHLWSHAEEQVRVHAFLVIRQMAIVSPYPFIEICMKGMYLTFVRNCKFPTPSVRPTLAFMLNSVVEIYRLDPNAAYQHAFVYIRQLAVHLRNAITMKKKDGFLQVYNWQFVYALKVWAKLLSESLLGGEEDGQLKPLLYPLTQVTIGAIKLIPTARYFPLRFHCIRTLLGLVQKTGVYIPLSGYILETLSFVEMKRKPKAATGRPLDFLGILKVPKSKINSALFQDAVLGQVFELSIEFYAAIACSIGFPEATFLDTRRFRAFLKLAKSKSVFSKMKPLLEKLEENGRYITSQRANVGFSPKEKDEIVKWSEGLRAKGQSPLMRYHKVWKASEVNRKAMQAAVQDVRGDDYEKASGKKRKGSQDGGKGGKKRKGGDDDDSDDDDDDSDDDADDDSDDGGGSGGGAAAADPDEAAYGSDAEISDGGESDDSDALGDFAMSDFESDGE